MLILLNAGAGTLAGLKTEDVHARVQSTLGEAGHTVTIEDPDLAQIDKVVEKAISDNYDAIIAGGGDGTINAIANAVAGGPLALGVLPLGTHNHFAREIGMPLDLDAALHALATAESRAIDVADVNGRIFLNFSAIGFHPNVVKHRDAQREAIGRSKFYAMFRSIIRNIFRLPLLKVILESESWQIRRLTPSVLVCTNALQMKQFGVETVSYPDRDRLNIYVARATGRLGFIWLILRAITRSLPSARHFENHTARSLTLKLHRPTLRVSIDGEVIDLQTPLVYSVRKGGLQTLVPRADVPQ